VKGLPRVDWTNESTGLGHFRARPWRCRAGRFEQKGHLLGRIVDIGAEVLLGLLRADGSSLLAVDPGWRPDLPCTAAGSGLADLLVFADPSGPATADFRGGSRQPASVRDRLAGESDGAEEVNAAVGRRDRGRSDRVVAQHVHGASG
jgi:hypothetical protein